MAQANGWLMMYIVQCTCNVNLRNLLSANKSHVRETSLFTCAIPNQVRNSQTSRFVVGSKPRKVKPRRQRGATVVTGGGGGRVVAQEYNRDRTALRVQSSVVSGK